MRAVNLTRPPLLPPCARHRPGQGVGVAEDGDRPPGWNPPWFRHSRATALLLGRNRGVGGIPAVGVTRTFRGRWTFPAGSRGRGTACGGELEDLLLHLAVLHDER